MKRWFLLASLGGMSLLSVGVLADPRLERLHTDGGVDIPLYMDGPKTATTGVVLVHDWFGISPFILESAARLSRDGYRVVAIDLYGGKRATTHEDAGALLKKLDQAVAEKQIEAAADLLAKEGKRVAIVAFSAGAKPAFAAALRDSSIRATVVWYGETNNDPDTLRSLSGPALLVVGSKDGPAADRAAAFSKAADAAGVKAEVHIYPGEEHAFAQPLFNAGRTYDAAARESAWRVTEDFLSRSFKPSSATGTMQRDPHP